MKNYKTLASVILVAVLVVLVGMGKYFAFMKRSVASSEIQPRRADLDEWHPSSTLRNMETLQQKILDQQIYNREIRDGLPKGEEAAKIAVRKYLLARGILQTDTNVRINITTRVVKGGPTRRAIIRFGDINTIEAATTSTFKRKETITEYYAQVYFERMETNTGIIYDNYISRIDVANNMIVTAEKTFSCTAQNIVSEEAAIDAIFVKTGERATSAYLSSFHPRDSVFSCSWTVVSPNGGGTFEVTDRGDILFQPFPPPSGGGN